MDYRALAEVLAMELGQTAEIRGRRAQLAGKKWAAKVAAAQRVGLGREGSTAAADTDDPLDRAAAQTTATFG